MNDRSRDGRVFWIAAVIVIVLDRITKALVVRHASPPGVAHDVLGSIARIRLAYNPGAAFSMSLGQYQRILFGAFAVAALAVVWWFQHSWRNEPHAEGGAFARMLALGLIWGGAAGNLIDRILSARGVVDFIDIGVGSVRFWTFNVADSGVTIGALLLAFVLWREEREMERAAGAAR